MRYARGIHTRGRIAFTRINPALTLQYEVEANTIDSLEQTS